MPRRKPPATSKPTPPFGYAGSARGDPRPSRAAERLLSVGEVAIRLRVCRSTAYAMIRGGDLSFVRVRGLVRVAATDVEDYLRLHDGRKKRPRRRGGRRPTA